MKQLNITQEEAMQKIRNLILNEPGLSPQDQKTILAHVLSLQPVQAEQQLVQVNELCKQYPQYVRLIEDAVIILLQTGNVPQQQLKEQHLPGESQSKQQQVVVPYATQIVEKVKEALGGKQNFKQVEDSAKSAVEQLLQYDSEKGREQFADGLEKLRQIMYGAYSEKQQGQSQSQILDKSKIQDQSKIKADAREMLSVMAQILQKSEIGKQAGVNVNDVLCGPDVFTALLTTGMDGFSSKYDRTASGTWPTNEDNTAHTVEIKVEREDIEEDNIQFTETGTKKLQEGLGKSKESEQVTIGIETHGILLDNEKSGKSPDDMQFVFAGSIVNNEPILSSIPAYQLFSGINAQRPQNKPLLVITTACYGGQARNDVGNLGKNAALITFPGRKYEG